MKAILVIDMPAYCSDCPLYIKEKDYCIKDKKVLGDDFYCTLKPMPKKKDIEQLLENFYKGKMEGVTRNGIKYAYVKGYNTCIDEILGEEE